jgi:translation machinery-associated protein 16
LLRSVDRHLYFVHALDTERTSISLPELHQLLKDYIFRNEDESKELAKERSERTWRKTEGKSKREIELDGEREKDQSEYRTGFREYFV